MTNEYSVIDAEGVEVTVWAQKIRGTLWVHYKGETFVVEDQSSQKNYNNKSILDPNSIVSPMPGKITSIKVAVGHDVEEQQPLIILEAMKMEYSLVASKKGKVKSIKVSVGDTVSLGDLLIELEG